MIKPQSSAKGPSGMVRTFQSTPPMADSAPAARMRLMAQAMRDGVEDDEADHKADQRENDAQRAAGLEERFVIHVCHVGDVAMAAGDGNG